MRSIGQFLTANLQIYRLAIAAIGIVLGILLRIQPLVLLSVFVACAYLVSWMMERRAISFSRYVSAAVPPILAMTVLFMPHLPKLVKLIVCGLVAVALVGTFFSLRNERRLSPTGPRST
jgi:hypothetical protein